MSTTTTSPSSSSPQPPLSSSTKKRPHDDPIPLPIQPPPPQHHISISPSPPFAPPLANPTSSSSPADNLLTPLPSHDWNPFTTRLNSALQSSLEESSRLVKEYEMWTWLYELWSTSHNHEETQRLGREMATLIRWAGLMEEELERAREQHRESMLAISGVLGIVPRGVSGGGI